jgi:hypothetical protein
VWFAYGAAQLGIALTVGALWAATPRTGFTRRNVILEGLVVGCAASLIVAYAGRARSEAGGYGRVDEIVFPVLILIILAIPLGVWWWKRYASRPALLYPLALAAVIGVLVPPATVEATRTLYRWLQPVDYTVDADALDYVSAAELSAIEWLRSNSDSNDVIATNLHCRPAPTVANCDARGFWVVGLSGRRAVLEGWAYTVEAQGLQGVDGLAYSRQPAPFVRRARSNEAVFRGSDVEALGELVEEFDVRWLVAVHRAGPAPTFPDDIAQVRFDNGEVSIFEVR